MIRFPLLAPIDTAAAGGDVKLGIKDEKFDDDTALLDDLLDGKDDDLLDDKNKDDDKNDDDKEPEVKLEDDEPDDLLLDEPTNNRGLDLTKIKEKYPDFAKTNEFRELRNAYHREAKFSELFPTVEDAQEAAENNDTFTKLNDDIVGRGDATSLLTSLKENNPESFKKVSTGFLDTIAKLDSATYVEVISPVIKRLVRQINNEGERYLKRNPDSDDGRALVATAKNILHYAFPDENVDLTRDDQPKTDDKITAKEKELEEREKGIAQEKFNSAYQLAAGSVERNLDKAILQGLDPDGKFNDFTKDTLLEKIKNSVKSQIDKDSLHLKKMASLWKRANSEGYSRDSLSRIVSAYLERARPIIPTERNKFRSIAIKGKAPNDDSNDNDIKIPARGRSGRTPVNDGRVNARNADPKKIDYSKTSDDDIYNGKLKLKA